jgi:hypothetical protein
MLIIEIQTCLNRKKEQYLRSKLTGKEEIIAAMEQFDEQHQKFLSKVDRRFVIDLFLRLREKPGEKPMYTTETGVELGRDTQAIRDQVIQMTGTAPQIYDKGTHIVANHRIDYELLKKIQDHPKVIEVKGTYMGSSASIGPSQESSAEIQSGEKEC